MRQLAIHSGHVRCVAYSPDGHFLATAGNDRQVYLFEAATGRMEASWCVIVWDLDD